MAPTTVTDAPADGAIDVLVIYTKEQIFAWIEGGRLEDVYRHIERGYPDLIDEWNADLLSATLLHLPPEAAKHPERYTVLSGKIAERPDLLLAEAKAGKLSEITGARRAALWQTYSIQDILERIALKYPQDLAAFTATVADLNARATQLTTAVAAAKTVEAVEVIVPDFSPAVAAK